MSDDTAGNPREMTRRRLLRATGGATLATATGALAATSPGRPAAADTLPVRLGPPEHLGDGVTVSMAQSAAFGIGPDGTLEQYIGVTGSPAAFAAVDPATGERLFSEYVPGNDVIWAMTIGSDGNVYFSGTSNGKLYRYLTAERRLEELGQNPSDVFVWDLGASSDGKIYGATYPRAKVFEYDIATGTFRDLGSMIDTEQYARGIEVTDRCLYVGVGGVTKALIRYDRATGEKTSLPIVAEGGAATISGIQAIGERLFVQSGSVLFTLDAATYEIRFSGRSIGTISPPSPDDPNIVYFKNADHILHTYDLTTDAVAPVDGVAALPSERMVRFGWIESAGGSGGAVLVGTSAFAENHLYTPGDNDLRTVHPDLPEEPTSLNVLSASGGLVFAGGYQRGMSVFDEATGEAVHRNKAFPQPEGIGHHHGVTWFGTYGGARMFRLDPERPYDFTEDATGNPGMVLDIGDGQDRPFTITSAGDLLFIGTIPGYGLLGGALTIVKEQREPDGTLRRVLAETYRNLVPDQSVTGLARRGHLLYGSTSITGGLGVEPTAENAKIFVFDLTKRRKIAEFTPELPGVDVPLEIIGELTFGDDGLLWGAADGTIFALDPRTYEVVKSKVVYPTLFDSSLFRPIYLEWGPEGYLYTTLGRHLVVVDPETLRTRELARDVHVMTLGRDGSVYYAVNSSQLYRLPRLD